jgi:DNA (cytosine-5)-methyltransferase 1
MERRQGAEVGNESNRENARRIESNCGLECSSKNDGGMANAGSGQLSFAEWGQNQRDGIGPDGADDSGTPGRPNADNSFWAHVDWIGCRDGKFRPVPGTVKSWLEPLVDEYSADLGYFLLPGGGEYGFSPLIEKGKARVGRLRLYGDAIVVTVAEMFIRAYMETLKDRQ